MKIACCWIFGNFGIVVNPLSTRTVSRYNVRSKHCTNLSLTTNQSRRWFLGNTAALSASVFTPIPSNAVDTTNTQVSVSAASATTTTTTATTTTTSTSTSTTTNPLLESLSGFVAGAALTMTKTIVKYPLDTATVRLQLPNSPYSLGRPAELFGNSFQGMTSPLVSNIPAGALFFAVKDATKQSLRQSELPKWASTMIAVGVALGPYWGVRNPSEVIKTRQQAGVLSEQTNAIEAAKQLFAQDGIAAFYKGYWENLVYAYPADVIKFVCYEALSGGRKSVPPVEGALYGAASTAVAQCLTTPLDVLRNRVMINQNIQESGSYLDALVDLAKNEGLGGLFAGVTPRVGKAILSGAIQFATYEETKKEVLSLFASGIAVQQLNTK